MFFENQIPNKLKNEKLILFLRRHMIVLVSRWLLFVLMAIVPIGFYYFILYTIPQFLSGQVGYAFLLLLGSIYYLFILLYFYNSFIDHYLDVWIVTNERIINIEQKGLFNREISEHSLDKVQDVSAVQKGFFSTFFSYGDVHVQTAGEVQRFIFRQVDNPFDVARKINALVQKHESEFDNKLFETIKQRKDTSE